MASAFPVPADGDSDDIHDTNRPRSFLSELAECIDFERIATCVISHLLTSGGPAGQASNEQIRVAGGYGEDMPDSAERVPVAGSQGDRSILRDALVVVMRIGRSLYEKHGDQLSRYVERVGRMSYEKFKQIAHGLQLHKCFSWSKLITLIVFGLVWIAPRVFSGERNVLTTVGSYLKQFFAEYILTWFHAAGGWEGLINFFSKEGTFMAAIGMATIGVICLGVGIGVFGLGVCIIKNVVIGFKGDLS